MSAPLTKLQKRYLSQLAERAYHREAALARGRGEQWDMSARAMTAWRHAQVAAAVQKLGLRCCSQVDYMAIKAHFLHLLGEDGQALAAHVRSQTEQTRQYQWKIMKTLETQGKPITYAEGICRRMFHGLALLDASPNQLWKILCALNAHQNRHANGAGERQPADNQKP